MPDRVASLVLADVGAGAESPFLLPSLARRWISLAERRGMSALADEMLMIVRGAEAGASAAVAYY